MSTIITISADIHAPVNKVWDYYTHPAHIIHWNFASDDWHCPKAANDLRVGGKLHSRMEAKDGSFGFDFEATYTTVEALQAIVYTIPDGRQVTVHFSETQNITTVTIHFDAEEQHPVDMQKNGWQAILNNFEQYTEAN